MSFHDRLFTSESVSAGHPDKVCDQISDAILDAFLTLDPDARVACEALAADAKIVVAGEFRTHNPDHFQQVRGSAERIVRETLRSIGYTSADIDIDPDRCEVEVRFNHQSPQIAGAVDRLEAPLGAGDQGMMFGYATDETAALMPLPWAIATDLLLAGSDERLAAAPWLRPDAKSQVTVRYGGGQPVGIDTVVLSWQHSPEISLAEVRAFLLEHVVDRVVPENQRTRDCRILVNPGGSWTIGGPKGDTGLTGRKIIVDTYGGACAHGGGAFSGKDPSKVDRSGAYAARYVAKHVVAAGLARRCTLQVAYAIGHTEPVSVSVDLHGTGRVSEEIVAAAIRDVFDLSPEGIIRELDLKRPIYKATAAYGHFGRSREAAGTYKWENTPRVEDLERAVATRSETSRSSPRPQFLR